MKKALSCIGSFLLVAVSASVIDYSYAQQWNKMATDRLKVVSESLEASGIAEIHSLVKAGADVDVLNEYGVTPLFMAAQGGYAEVVKLLLEAKADVNIAKKNGVTPLYQASWQGHSEVVKLLIQAGANVNAAKKNGSTPLFMASQEGHAEVVRLLLEAGANVNSAGVDGVTALYVASQDGYNEIVKQLIKAGANVNARKNNGFSTLSMASQNGHSEIVKLLLKADADVNASDERGRTPLLLAANNGYSEVVKLLTKAGADVDAEMNGYTPLSLAKRKGHAKVVQLLEAAGARKAQQVFNHKQVDRLYQEDDNKGFLIYGRLHEITDTEIRISMGRGIDTYIRTSSTQFFDRERNLVSSKMFKNGEKVIAHVNHRKILSLTYGISNIDSGIGPVMDVDKLESFIKSIK